VQNNLSSGAVCVEWDIKPYCTHILYYTPSHSSSNDNVFSILATLERHGCRAKICQ